VFHSRIAAKSHGCSHLDHMWRFFIKSPFGINWVLEIGKYLSLIFG
jgi:hypothetical protein